MEWLQVTYGNLWTANVAGTDLVADVQRNVRNGQTLGFEYSISQPYGLLAESWENFRTANAARQAAESYIRSMGWL